jgi:hypothetical protein
VARAEIHPAALTALSVEQASSPRVRVMGTDVREEAAYRCSSIGAQPPASHPHRRRADHRVRGIAHRLDGRRLRSYLCSSPMHLLKGCSGWSFLFTDGSMI